jgi:hypothetical protein
MDKDQTLGIIGQLMEASGLNLEDLTSHQSNTDTSNSKDPG